MSEAFWIALVTALIPATVTLLSNRRQDRENARKHEEMQNLAKQNASRASIETKIMQDKIRVLFGQLPENYRAIHEEYERYHQEHGNGVVTREVDEYDDWRASLQIHPKGEC